MAQPDVEAPRWSARALLLAWSAPVVFATPFVVLSIRAGGQTVALWRVLIIVAATWYVWAAMTPVIVRFANRWRLERPIGARAIALHLAAAFLACVVQALSAAIAIELLVPAPGATFGQLFVYWLLLLLPAGVVVYSAVVGFRTAELNRAESIARERQAQRLAAQLSEAQLAALRSQIQPHFLFNALNAVIALVRDHETENAVEALTTLSALLRTALRTGAAHETTLCAEVAFTTNYVAMERLRFGDRVRLTVDVPQSLGNAHVPTFLLQPFVENALRHGLRGQRDRLRVDISARRENGRLTILVEDDGAGLAADWEARSANGFGISNSRARLRQLYGADASLAVTSRHDPHVTSVAIVLPYREGAPALPAAVKPA